MSSCLMALLGLIALSSFVFTAEPKGDLAASVRVCVHFSRRACFEGYTQDRCVYGPRGRGVGDVACVCLRFLDLKHHLVDLLQCG